MKLVTKITWVYVALLSMVLAFAGILTYEKVKHSVQRETDFYLRTEARIAAQGIEDGKPAEILSNDKIHISEISMEEEEDKSGIFSDTLMLHRYFKTPEVFRKHISTYKINDKHYSIMVADVVIEKEDMLNGVVSSMFEFFIASSILFLAFSWLLSKWLLKPFETTLARMGEFDIRSDNRIKLEKTSTEEFNHLNQFVSKMTD